MSAFGSVDLLWKLLMIVAMSSTIVFSAFLFAQFFIRKQAGTIYNRLAQLSNLIVMGTFLAGGIFLIFFDQDISEKCFCNFAGTNRTFGVTRILALLWLAGFVTFLAKDFYFYSRFKKNLQSQVLKRHGSFLEVPAGIAPLSFGLWRASIVIPQTLVADEKVLAPILAHECVHMKNRDGLWNFLALLVQRLAWFNPLSYFFEKGRNLAMEMATDEETIQNNSFSVQEYCESLLAALAAIQEAEKDRLASPAVQNYRDLKLRLENLGAGPHQSENSYRKWLALAVMMVGWIWGTNQSFASIRMVKSSGPVLMCYQVQQEKIIEEWLNMKTEANKCE